MECQDTTAPVISLYNNIRGCAGGGVLTDSKMLIWNMLLEGLSWAAGMSEEEEGRSYQRTHFCEQPQTIVNSTGEMVNQTPVETLY